MALQFVNRVSGARASLLRLKRGESSADALKRLSGRGWDLTIDHGEGEDDVSKYFAPRGHVQARR